VSVLFAVKSCNRDRESGLHQTVRETWGQHIVAPNELRFFVGQTAGLSRGDEFPVPAPDGYADLPYKVREIMRHFLATRHTYIFLCDADTFIIPSKLLGQRYEETDFLGIIIKGMKPGQKYIPVHTSRSGKESYAPPSGGFGYFLSRRAAEIIANTEPDPKVTEDDVYVGEALGPYFESGELVGYQPPDYHDYAFHFLKSRQAASFENVNRWMRRLYVKTMGVV
jgi:hypothetical protein